MTDSLSEWVSESPIELFWTIRNTCMLQRFACQLASAGQSQTCTRTHRCHKTIFKTPFLFSLAKQYSKHLFFLSQNNIQNTFLLYFSLTKQYSKHLFFFFSLTNQYSKHLFFSRKTIFKTPFFFFFLSHKTIFKTLLFSSFFVTKQYS